MKNELNFYKVDKEYVEYLRKEEIKSRGFSCIPLLNYDSIRKEKFMCGFILEFRGMKYLAPVSSYSKQQKNNILLYDKNGKVTSSVRLNYMFPVTEKYYTFYDFSKEVDEKYRSIIQEERDSANKQKKKIRQIALKTYQTVKKLKENSCSFNWACDFPLLEKALKNIINSESNPF